MLSQELELSRSKLDVASKELDEVKKFTREAHGKENTIRKIYLAAMMFKHTLLHFSSGIYRPAGRKVNGYQEGPGIC